MKKLALYLLVLVFANLTAAENDSKNETASNEASKTQESSAADRVVETIAEAAINDRDYGKDIGDR